MTGILSTLGRNKQKKDPMRESAALTTVYLLEQNRKFKVFMRQKVEELETRVAAQQARLATRAEAEELMSILGKFFMNHTKAELLELAVENRFQLGPCNNAKDVLQYPQLIARDFWKEIEHPELGTSIAYPRQFVESSEEDCSTRFRAPLIGEHNKEVYSSIGLSGEEIILMEQAGII